MRGAGAEASYPARWFGRRIAPAGGSRALLTELKMLLGCRLAASARAGLTGAFLAESFSQAVDNRVPAGVVGTG